MIKYFEEMMMPPTPWSNNNPIIDAYHIIFDDDSEIELQSLEDRPFYSKIDCVAGKMRNKFINQYKPSDAKELLDGLRKSNGLTNTNKGNVVLVNKKNIKPQIII